MASQLDLQLSPRTYRIPASTYQNGELLTRIRCFPADFKLSKTCSRWGVGLKYRSAKVLCQLQELYNHGSRSTSGSLLLTWVLCNQTMKVSRDMSRANHGKNVRYNVARTKRDLRFFEKLHGIGNKAALGHTEQIVQRFQTFPSFCRRQSSLASVLFINP